jgi:hypothetical protein
MMTTTIRAVTTSLHEVSTSMVFPLSKPLPFQEPFPPPCHQAEVQSTGQQFRGSPVIGNMEVCVEMGE